MRSILLIAFANLRRRRGQSILVGAILALSALMLYTGIGIFREIDAPVHRMREAQRASQLTLFFDPRIHDQNSLRTWWLAQPGVVAVSEPLATIELREGAFFKGRQLGRLLMATERPVTPSDQDSIRIVDGRAAATPGPGEVWLPTGLADEMGMHAGDTCPGCSHGTLYLLREPQRIVVSVRWSTGDLRRFKAGARDTLRDFSS